MLGSCRSGFASLGVQVSGPSLRGSGFCDIVLGFSTRLDGGLGVLLSGFRLAGVPFPGSSFAGPGFSTLAVAWLPPRSGSCSPGVRVLLHDGPVAPLHDPAPAREAPGGPLRGHLQPGFTFGQPGCSVAETGFSVFETRVLNPASGRRSFAVRVLVLANQGAQSRKQGSSLLNQGSQSCFRPERKNHGPV